MGILVGLAAFLAGLVLGLLYFGGLWLTLQRLPRSPHPSLLILGSYLLRLGAVLPGFYLIMGGRWERLALAMGGFLLVRIGLTRHLAGGGRKAGF